MQDASNTVEPVAVATTLVESFCAADWERFRAGITDDVEFVATGTAGYAAGADAVVDFFRGIRLALPDLAGTIASSSASGNLAILSIDWTGTHSAPLRTSVAEIQPSGRRVVASSRWLCRVSKGKVCNVRDLDTLTLLAAFGPP